MHCKKICGLGDEYFLEGDGREDGNLTPIWKYTEDTITVNMEVYRSRATSAPIMRMQTYQNLITGFILYINTYSTIYYSIFLFKKTGT